MKYSGLMLESRPCLAEPSATVLLDYSRRHSNGAFAADGKPDWIRLNSGLWVTRFNGSDATVSFTDSAYLNSILTGNFSVCFWTYFNQLSSGSQQLVRKRDGANGASIYHDGNTYLSFATGNGSSTYSSANNTLAAGVWQFWAFIYIASGNFYVTIYLNAVDVTTAHQNHPLPTFPGSTLYLGSNNGASGWFNGDMALPRIYNCALTSTQITAMFQNERTWFGV